jgi:fumarate reductase flavoprotein subunit
MSDMGAILWADTPADLAAAAGIDADGLSQTVAAYNRAARGEAADAFGRTAYPMAPLEPPFAVARVKPGLFHTQGGLLVDEHARVRAQGGGVIENLFAGGGAAVGISGRSGAMGYASGNGLITALVLGRRAGLRAVAEVRGAS